jgi:hypothetical protein
LDLKFIENNITLLIPCTVDATGIANNLRTNIVDRTSDIEQSLENWINLALFSKILIVENSGYKGNLFNSIKKKYINKVYIEIVIYDGQNFDRKYGKGYGWYASIKKAIENSQLGKNSEIFTIVPGRYFIPNAKKIITNLKCNMMCNLNNNLTFAFSPIAVFTREFIVNYWLPECKKSNESIGMPMEKYQARAVLRAIADGHKWELPSEDPILQAISGTSNMPYMRGFFHTLTLRYYSYLKKFVFEFKR